MRLVRSKTKFPVRTSSAAARERIHELVRRSLDSGAHVRVSATAGSGKTTAVSTALIGYSSPVAWLTLDRMDASPGRLLTYIEAALRTAAPDLTSVVSESLRSGATLVDTAAFLAEALDELDLVFVLDNTENLADSSEACEVLDTFLMNVPLSVRTVEIGRVELGHRSTDPLREPTSVLGDAVLAFTEDEAERVLTTVGAPDIDATEAVRATGGWITGILFELWRYSDHNHGDGGETDPLNGYLSNEIMARLGDAQRHALVVTSLLDEVTPSRAEAIGIVSAGEVLHSLSKLHLPVEFDSSRTAMQAHPRFREYLRTQFDRRDADAVRASHRAHGRLLVAERRHEEAIEEFLDAGDVDSAADVVEKTLPVVLDRLDFALAEQWLGALGSATVRRSPWLLAGAVRIACERERYSEGAEYADRLLAAEVSAEVLNPTLITTVAWCYFLVSRIGDAQALLDSAPDASEIRMMRFCIGIELLDDPTHYRDRPPDCDGPADGLLARADLAHGRFNRVLDSHSKPWESIELARIGALRALGRTAEAATRMESTLSTNWTAVRTRAEVMSDTAQYESAYTALLQGRDSLARSGSNLYRMFSLLFEASLALRFRGDTQFARAALNEVEREHTALRRARIVEQLHLWRGLALLLDNQNGEAREQLRAAVDVMIEWDRLLYLPIAAAYLAEAEWRLGGHDAADTAADIALSAATSQGSQHLLIQVLREFPGIASRRLDAENDPDSPWRSLGRAVLRSEVASIHQLTARVTSLDVGQQALEVDGAVVVPKLVKSVELLSFLALEGGRVSKAVLVDRLFENSPSESAAAYFRMALNGLRKVLPADAPFGMDGTDLVWTGDTLASSSVAIEAAVASVPQLPPEDQHRTIDDLIAQLGAGEFLPRSRSEWVLARRERLWELHTEVLELGAHAAYKRDDYRRANLFVEEVLGRDPLRERSWRLAMRVASALGDQDRVTAVYRRCVRALADIGAEPQVDTIVLAHRLRGEPAPGLR